MFATETQCRGRGKAERRQGFVAWNHPCGQRCCRSPQPRAGVVTIARCDAARAREGSWGGAGRTSDSLMIDGMGEQVACWKRKEKKGKKEKLYKCGQEACVKVLPPLTNAGDRDSRYRLRLRRALSWWAYSAPSLCSTCVFSALRFRHDSHLHSDKPNKSIRYQKVSMSTRALRCFAGGNECRTVLHVHVQGGL